MSDELLKNEKISMIDETETETETEDEGHEVENWEDWNENNEEEDEGASESDLLCLFCENRYTSCTDLFEHCSKFHRFDFDAVKKALELDFYGCFKLINFVRAKVSENRCWSCDITCQSTQDLHKHLHELQISNDIKLLLGDDLYLKPFMQEDALLYSFAEDEDGEEDYPSSSDKEEQLSILQNLGAICINDENDIELFASKTLNCDKIVREDPFASNGCLNLENLSNEVIDNGKAEQECDGLSDDSPKNKHVILSVAARDIKKVNENYFGAYSSFGIHREMISDKVRTDAYRQAILNNPSLLSGAVVMDVGCGTGILSLFAAQAGASTVISVEASEKMAAVATKIAKDNGLLYGGSKKVNNTGVIKVVKGMVEELEKFVEIQPHSVDVLLSEWMGYCLLYETMLSSVLFARDKWLKPGGAILPDTATIFAAGFGKGGTSVPFWEDVYGFNMSCIGKELIEDAAQNPIVDVVDGRDIVTNSVALKIFDLATMTAEEMDFTASIELEPIKNTPADSQSNTTWCYGVVLWFETGFTSRFCKEMATVLSTSPHTPKTHWAQTIFTFQEPIAIASGEFNTDKLAAVGSEACPARNIQSRISIVRAAPHRSIDISMEISSIGLDGRKRSWPVQIFNLK